MRCRYPVLLNVKGRLIYVPCGHCAWCLSAYRDEWVFRMKIEAKDHLYNYFNTFTYRDEDLEYSVNSDTGELVPTVCMSHIQNFHRKLRKDGFKFRFLVSSEYGPQTFRPHYHGIYFCDQPMDFEKLWPHGDNNVQLPASEASMKYVLKYMLKGSHVPDGAQPNFRLMSLRPGIGSRLDIKNNEHLPFYLIDENGSRRAVPRYYKKGYYKSLAPEIVEIESEKRLDYLADVLQHGELRRKFESLNLKMDFETWLDKIYKKDLNKQKQLNNVNFRSID